MDFVTTHLGHISGSVVLLGIAFGQLLLMKKVADAMTPFDDRMEIEDKGNMAVSLRQVGLLVGLGFALTGPLSGASQSFWLDVQNMFIEGLIVIGLLTISSYINDHLILHSVDNNKAVQENNIAVGIVEMGSYVATGLIAAGSFSGDGGGLGSAIVFFAIGQALLVIISALASYGFGFDPAFQVGHGNQAAGVVFGGFLVSMGIILGASLTGPFTGWTADIMSFSLYAGVGAVLLWACTWLADHFFLPTTTLSGAVVTQKNAASALLLVAPMIVVAIIVAAGVL